MWTVYQNQVKRNHPIRREIHTDSLDLSEVSYCNCTVINEACPSNQEI